MLKPLPALRKLAAVVTDAFDEASLDQTCSACGKDFSKLVVLNAPFDRRVSALIERAFDEGWLAQLGVAMQTARPLRTDLGDALKAVRAANGEETVLVAHPRRDDLRSLTRAEPGTPPSPAAPPGPPTARMRWTMSRLLPGRAPAVVGAAGVLALIVALVPAARRWLQQGGEVSCPEGAALIPGGRYPGSRRSTGRNLPARTVGSFCMDREEVTVDRYQRCVNESGCQPTPGTVFVRNWDLATTARWSRLCNGAADVGHPLNCVDFNAAQAFCARAGGRLPTETQWAIAAAGTEGRRFPWGNAAPR